MPTFLSRFISIFTIASVLAFAAPFAHAQDSIHTAADAFGPVNPGTFDLTLGVGGFFYNTIEPGADMGLIPVSDVGTISMGGYLDAGYCLLGCFLFNSLMNWASDGQANLRLRAFHINPMARGLFHLNILAEALDLRSLDVYGGLVAGPSFYNVNLRVMNESADMKNITFLIGPTVGLRYTLGDGQGFFVFGEARYLVEFGSTTYQLQTSDGYTYSDNGLVRRGGRNLKFGVGFRF